MIEPLLTVVVATCRPDKPFRHHKDWHVLDRIIENCKKQTFRDFELIIVDLLYDYRSSWLGDRWPDLDFPVLHLIDKSSVFRELNLTRICCAKNTGLLYARGKAVVFTDDGQDWSENAFECLAPWARNGAGATCRLHRDRGRGPIEVDSRWMAHKIEGTLRTKVVQADGIGYLGGTLSMVPLEKMIECNGFDEMFDGSRQLEDSDMARRLGAAGLKMALEGHPTVVEYALTECDGRIHRMNVEAKCNGAYIYPIWNENPKRIRANDHALTDEMLDTFMTGECVRLDSDNRCMESRDECKGSWHRRSLMNIYKDQRLVFDLAEMRKKRSWSTVHTDPVLVGDL